MTSTPFLPTSGWIDATSFMASGSEFETFGSIAPGSQEILLEDAGDFQVGQQVEILGCNLHHYGTVYNDREPYYAANQSPLTCDQVELRGLATGKTWQTFVVHFEAGSPMTWRWMAIDPALQTKVSHKPVLVRSWCWQGEGLPLTDDWFPLCDGVEIRFRKRDWLPGQSISFHARNQLLSRILERRGNLLRLEGAGKGGAERALVRHHDQAALQLAVDQAIAERKRLLIPAGRYRLSSGLKMRNATLHVEGVGRELTQLDVSDAHTAVFWIAGGREVSVRNLAMTGHSGFLEVPSGTHFKTANGFAFWPTANQQMEIKGCSAVNAVGTEHLLFEDLKVSRMASEAFYLHGSDRYGMPPYIQAPHEGMPELAKQFTKSCIYHRVHVSDCGFNAFNNNDHAENTSILHCHVERAVNFCEQASRFTRIIGNYVKDGTSAGVHGGRLTPGKVGPVQAVITDNVFEGGTLGGGISINNSASQVIVANNLFVGFSKESPLFLLGGRRIVVTGNHFDMTRLEDSPDHERCGICIETSNVTVANNHIYVRGERSEKVGGIHVADDSVNIHLHDNLIENCEFGLRSGRRLYKPENEEGKWFEFGHTECEVVEVSGPQSFRVAGMPARCDDAHPYRGWHIAWVGGALGSQTSTMKSFDAGKSEVTLKDKTDLQVGSRFTIYPDSANWQVHHNTFADCANPLSVNLLSQKGICIRDSIVSS